MKKKIKISDKALKLINQKQIKPIPKWEFMIKNLGLWLVFVLCLILLGIGISISLFGLVDDIIIPYLWVFFVFIFFGLSYLLFKKTKKSYRFNKSLILIFIILISITAGGILFKTGIANRIDKRLGAKSVYYRQIVPMKMQAWNNPSQGYLSGTIVKIIDNNNFEIKDFSNNSWKINGNNPIIRGRVLMENGQEVKLIGKQTDKNIFIVEEIRPWAGMGRNMLKENY